ncbi:MAG: hypothetical protein QNJ65_06150 [Xenococcaceae cyanobacterium MO_234.B1]|nr:hypothetical protein [Xenococcaceae cyanobacterium MO_234.B1]
MTKSKQAPPFKGGVPWTQQMQWFKHLLAQNPGTFVENPRVNLVTRRQNYYLLPITYYLSQPKNFFSKPYVGGLLGQRSAGCKLQQLR